MDRVTLICNNRFVRQEIVAIIVSRNVTHGQIHTSVRFFVIARCQNTVHTFVGETAGIKGLPSKVRRKQYKKV